MTIIDELRDLRYFIEVARCRSFASAAVRLSVSPGAISKAISRLEESLKLTLLVRSSRVLRLTPDGELLVNNLDEAYQHLERSWDSFFERDGEVGGIVHLSTFSIYSRTRLAHALPSFTEKYPHVEIIVSVHDQGHGPSRNRSDIRVTWNEELDEDKVAKKLAPLPLILVGSVAYLKMHGTPEAPDDLLTHKCLGGIGSTGTKIRWEFTSKRSSSEDREERFVLSPRGPIGVMDEMVTVADFVRQGLGLTIVDPLDVQRDLEEGTLVRLLEDYDIGFQGMKTPELTIQYRPRPKLSKAANLLVDHLVAFHRGAADAATGAEEPV